jgi:hypothetical protein
MGFNARHLALHRSSIFLNQFCHLLAAVSGLNL